MNLELTEEEAGQQGDYRAKPPRAGDLQCHRPSARGFAEHDPAATAWRGECRQRRLCPNPDLPCARRAAELLYAVGVHGRTAAPGAQIATARAERVRSLDPDIAGVERKGAARLTPCHWKPSRKNCAIGA